MESFFSDNLSAVKIIQLMLAPGIMISACGLLLLGINNKYSIVVNRIRLLNDEKRKYSTQAGEKNLDTEETLRLTVISEQIGRLVYRVKLVKNAVLCYTGAIGSFVLSSMLIGLESFIGTKNVDLLIILAFLAGMMLVLLGVIFASMEIIKGYDIIKFEVEAHE